jgi:hypothetical protein
MATTQTTKRKTTQTKRSTAAKKAAATRARSTAATQARRAQTSAKRRITQPKRKQTPVVATAQYVGAKAGNAVQTGILAGSKAAAAVTRRVAKIF